MLTKLTSTFLLLTGAFAEEVVSIEKETYKHLVSFFQDHSESQDLISSVSGEVEGSFISKGDFPSGDCKSCVWHGAEFATKMTVHHVEKWCARTNSVKAKRMCLAAEQHPHIALGFLIEELRPMSLAFSYCMGKGECKPWHKKELADTDEDINAAALEPMLKQFMDVDFDIVDNGIKDDEKDFEYDVEKCAEDHQCKCGSCMEAATFRLQNDHFSSIMAYCDRKSKCPFIQKVCKAVRRWPEETYGFIMGALKPWKFASGFCVARHYCSYSHFHHHGHHGCGGDPQESHHRGHPFRGSRPAFRPKPDFAEQDVAPELFAEK